MGTSPPAETDSSEDNMTVADLARIGLCSSASSDRGVGAPYAFASTGVGESPRDSSIRHLYSLVCMNM
jgi:hypothetical protein